MQIGVGISPPAKEVWCEAPECLSPVRSSLVSEVLMIVRIDGNLFSHRFTLYQHLLFG